jgi:hypothetical protein
MSQSVELRQSYCILTEALYSAIEHGTAPQLVSSLVAEVKSERPTHHKSIILHNK